MAHRRETTRLRNSRRRNREHAESREGRLAALASNTRAKVQRFYMAAAFLALAVGGGALRNVNCNFEHGSGSDDITSGRQFANSGPEQTALAAELKRTIPDAVEDEASGYVICGPRVKHILKEPLVQFEMCGKKELIFKKSIAERIQRANERMQERIGKCIVIRSTTRSNVANSKESAANNILFTTANSAKGKCTGAHILGQAADVINYDEAYPFLAEEGFDGGLGGVWKDPWHFYDPSNDVFGPALTGLARETRINANRLFLAAHGAESALLDLF